mmetsp:Transcript_54164/g.108784  ORF Transcript_54164/g.108784 Transcript_54164/m.108784 type:complete len:167 (-) Transcript_54164:31-531(-)
MGISLLQDLHSASPLDALFGSLRTGTSSCSRGQIAAASCAAEAGSALRGLEWWLPHGHGGTASARRAVAFLALKPGAGLESASTNDETPNEAGVNAKGTSGGLCFPAPCPPRPGFICVPCGGPKPPPPASKFELKRPGEVDASVAANPANVCDGLNKRSAEICNPA